MSKVCCPVPILSRIPLGLAAAIVTAATFGTPRAVDRVALKMAVDKWHVAPKGSDEKAIQFGVAEGIRWTEGGIQSNYRILYGAVAIIFGTAIVMSSHFSGGSEFQELSPVPSQLAQVSLWLMCYFLLCAL